MGFSGQEYWSGLLCPSPGDLPDTGIKPASPASRVLQVDILPTESPGNPIYHSSYLLSRGEITVSYIYVGGFPSGSVGKESAFDAEDVGLISRSGRSPGGEHGNPFQYFCLENPIDRGACQAAVHRVT